MGVLEIVLPLVLTFNINIIMKTITIRAARLSFTHDGEYEIISAQGDTYRFTEEQLVNGINDDYFFAIIYCYNPRKAIAAALANSKIKLEIDEADGIDNVYSEAKIVSFCPDPYFYKLAENLILAF